MPLPAQYSSFCSIPITNGILSVIGLKQVLEHCLHVLNSVLPSWYSQNADTFGMNKEWTRLVHKSNIATILFKIGTLPACNCSQLVSYIFFFLNGLWSTSCHRQWQHMIGAVQLCATVCHIPNIYFQTSRPCSSTWAWTLTLLACPTCNCGSF